MKRLALSLILALIIHGLVLSTDGKWPQFTPPLKPDIKPITMSLAYRQSQKPVAPAPRPIDKKRKPRPSTLNPLVSERQHLRKIDPVPKTTPNEATVPVKIRPAREKVKRTITRPEPLKKRAGPEELTFPDIIEPAVVPDIPTSSFRKKSPEIQPEDISTGRAEKNETVPVHPRALPDRQAPGETVEEVFPLYKENPPPMYPRIAKKRGYQGTVLLEVLVTQNGTAGEIRIVRSSRHSILDKAAISSVKKWLFVPGKKAGNNVDMWVKVPIRFHLEE